MKVVAAVTPSTGAQFSVETVELDEPRADEILVRIMAAGVCHTDLVARDGVMPITMPAVLGHEGAGVVVRVGDAVTKVKEGDRVALTFRSCGGCARCKAGEPAYCATMPALNYVGQRADGSKAISRDGERISSNFFGQSSFATHALAYERNVVVLPDDIPFELAAPLGCGVQTGVGSILRALACPAGSSLLIAGGGAVGLSAVMGAAIQGCHPIIVVEINEERRRLALKLGATHAIDPMAQEDLTDAVRAIVPAGIDFVLDTTGRPQVLEAGFMSLAPRGVFGFVGVAPPNTKPPGIIGRMVMFGLTLRGIIEGDSDPDEFIPQLVQYWREGRLPLEKLVQLFPFSDINDAVQAQHAGECVKVVLALNE
ncbi:NAD(P)-dependent alcohol dehydrogenase [Sphingobium sp. JS3065]|uniref:NAD(P)-dependent alcohol dehydrogenase n=1 Tax=Sphingobium sp. JS3065 TaxID=2970925 RepID=UPI0022641012|nr:NAD(P)-dependent alcohol dehydrogenase [Sphingobium sp. JS3065]UZW56396.1 NAD(P)-dependent alcohol dehydrogenase [Sphingobium sp. JS3065]